MIKKQKIDYLENLKLSHIESIIRKKQGLMNRATVGKRREYINAKRLEKDMERERVRREMERTSGKGEGDEDEEQRKEGLAKLIQREVAMVLHKNAASDDEEGLLGSEDKISLTF